MEAFVFVVNLWPVRGRSKEQDLDKISLIFHLNVCYNYRFRGQGMLDTIGTSWLACDIISNTNVPEISFFPLVGP